MEDTAERVHLLWTGGWDSTYRLLYLLREGREVQPHYIIDQGRRSADFELRAIEAISKRIHGLSSELSGTLLPVRISEKKPSVQNREVEEAYDAIVKEMYIGDQYMWLADYCQSNGIEGMEIGVEENPIFLKQIRSELYPYNVIFGKFRFPILSTSKRKMKEWAEATGTLPVMELTWFCHRPTAKAQPCGRCHPCEVTMKGGMAYRFPLTSRIRYHLRVVPRLRAFVKTFPGFYYVLYSLRHNR